MKNYADSVGIPVFINIGGGEPFLRGDIVDVLKMASDIFTPIGVGVDTNGSLDNSYDLICQAIGYVSYVGISINGLEEYHNWWSGNSRINAFSRSMDTVRRLCENDLYRNKIEVTSVASKHNLEQLPVLMKQLKNIKVENYSIHRAIPVGRMTKMMDIIPDSQEYLDLLVSIIEKSKEIGLSVHLHHSIESIHKTLLLGLETYAPDKVGNPDIGSSLGIEPEGHLVFDPWCTTGIWKMLSSGNIYNDTTDFASLLDSNKGTIFDMSKTFTAPHLRCDGCDYPCSGGSRIASAAYALGDIRDSDIKLSDILNAMTAVDPACPLFDIDE